MRVEELDGKGVGVERVVRILDSLEARVPQVCVWSFSAIRSQFNSSQVLRRKVLQLSVGSAGRAMRSC